MNLLRDSDKKIIADCDGVLLDWCYAFDVWMCEHGYKKTKHSSTYYEQSIRYGISESESNRLIKKFNESGCVGFIPAYKDSVEYVNKLHLNGWTFEVISCLDKDKYSQKLRENNLIHLFGNVFDFIDCSLDYRLGKKKYLLDRYNNKKYFWIEDSVSHAKSGEEVGLTSVIMDHEYNKEWKGLRVKNWKEVYQLIENDSTH